VASDQADWRLKFRLSTLALFLEEKSFAADMLAVNDRPELV
jgi:hypothetical protein